MTFAEYLKESAAQKASHGEWRMGQTYFNVLHQFRPDLSDEVRATRIDPFHRDNYIGEFLTWVAENWEGKP